MNKYTCIYNLTLFVLVIVLTGCKESSFELSKESRLPLWFEVPAGMARTDLRVTMDYYIRPGGRKAVFTLRDRNNQVLDKVTGIQQGMEPIKLKNQTEKYTKNRPLYEIITVDGIMDIIEHRARGPFFHMADNPNIMEELGIE